MNAAENLPEALVDAALAYAAEGVPVFPCRETSKRPYTTHGFKEATTDAEQIRRWWAKWPGAMIGMPTGAASGVWALDIDDPGAFEPACPFTLPATRRSDTGKGYHLHFAYREEIRNAQRPGNGGAWPIPELPGAEVRGEGGYIILPPSRHPSGRLYRWANDNQPASAPAELVAIVTAPRGKGKRPSIASASTAPISNAAAPPRPPVDEHPYALAALEGECEAIRCATDGGQEATLNRAGLKIGHFVGGGVLRHETARARLIAAGLQMPSHNPADPWTPEIIMAKVDRALRDGMAEPKGVPDASPEPLRFDRATLTAGGRAHNADMQEMLAQAATVKSAAQADRLGEGFDWRAGLGDGALAQFVDYAERTAPSPQPFLALGAALSAFGALAGRRYKSPTGIRSNIYVIGLCDSGGGKDHALGCIQDLFAEAGLTNKLGGSRIASGQAMITDITRAGNLIYPLDELGFMLNRANGRNSSTHDRLIVDNLTELYSRATKVFLGTSYADQSEKPRQPIDQPCLCLFGITTPQSFWGSFSSSNVIDGSLSRMLVIESENHFPDPNLDLGEDEMPPALIEAAKAVNAGAEGHITFPLGEGPQQKPSPYLVPFATRDADERFKEIRLEQIEMLRRNQGSNKTSAIARLAENAMKIALIKAVSDNPARPAITVEALNWGRGLAGSSVDRLLDAIRNKVADTDEERNRNKALQIIRDAGPNGIQQTPLKERLCFFKSTRDREDALTMLEEAGRIMKIERPRADGKPGRPSLWFVAT